jgi:AraC-like DNA-binding protein
MPRTLAAVDRQGLERSCTASSESIRFGAGAPGLDRAAVSLSRTAFTPHRHDAYALGVTTGGVQTFRYRGARRVCLPGQLHVLHPDELHDGAPGTDDGFTYRIVYLAPELVREALADAPLPFVADPVQPPLGPLAATLASLLADLAEPIGRLRAVEAAVAVADGLAQLADRRPHRPATLDVRAVGLVRGYLAAHACEPIGADTLERVAGTDRYTIVRHFKAAYGTTPDRYRLLRRLDVARAAIGAGRSLAQAAADAGFADQSHLTRQFKRAYGMTPGRWRHLIGRDSRCAGSG